MAAERGTARTRALAGLVVSTLTLGLATACASSGEATAGLDGSASEVSAEAPDSGDRGPATACGDAGGVRTVAQLPAGACTETSSCALAVWHPCPCSTEHAAIDGYACRCEGGAWRCEKTAAGATVCLLDATCHDRFVDAARAD